MKEFTIQYRQTESGYEYALRFKGSDREHIFDRFIDVGFFLKALDYAPEFPPNQIEGL